MAGVIFALVLWVNFAEPASIPEAFEWEWEGKESGTSEVLL